MNEFYDYQYLHDPIDTLIHDPAELDTYFSQFRPFGLTTNIHENLILIKADDMA